MTISPRLTLIRGVPGSGKSTMAQAMTDHVHFEADMYMIEDGAYQYNPEKVAESHFWCRAQMREALVSGKNVVISNTFSRAHEMSAYLAIARELGVAVEVVEAKGCWQNVHGVPAERIEQMRQRWEKITLG